MFKQRETNMQKALISAAAFLLLLPSSEQMSFLTTEAPPSNSSLTTQANNGSMEAPRVLRTHRSCGGDHPNYCENGGECMYPQDSDKPSCICTSSYGGPRCLFFVDNSRAITPELEQLIGITFGVLMLIVVLAIIFYCFVCKRCVKSAPVKKSAPPESTV